ncbi:MAG: Mut7-C RNAse domain-containing protein [Gemmatimonadota bacterium]
MGIAQLRFYEELNDFLAPALRKREFDYAFARSATVKNAIEALGVPHTEVELILVNGRSVDFSHRMQEGDRVSVYPKFEAFDVAPLVRVRSEPLRRMRFIADSHLGGLARLLRMAGFDTLHDNHYIDHEIRRLAAADARIVLTRDRELLKCRDITHGCYVRALKPSVQLGEIVERLQLAASMAPFTLCLYCNLPLTDIGKDEVLDRLPPTVAANYERFRTCAGCRRVFWEGSHWRRMRELLARVVPEPDPGRVPQSFTER